MNIWPDLIKLIQLKPRFLFGIWFSGSIIIFGPDLLINGLGLDSFRLNYRIWIGLVTLCAFSFWLVQLIPFIQNKWLIRKRKNTVIQSLESLSDAEFALLLYCYENNRRTICLEITHSTASALCQKGLLDRSGVEIGSSIAWPFTVPFFVWEKLPGILTGERNKKPEIRRLLALYENKSWMSL